ncbi:MULTISPECIES: hypothetical protein [unclassified Pseudomonas]|uniref:hypothetical protein n=1 Tax=unclassified Pseudomonas TaxID=196821 RepID=UPI0025F0A214|nr:MULTISPECIES: hypothetical protein [unclassified Pseudomonas]
MNIFKHAVKACRSASRSLLTPAHTVSRIKPALVNTLDRFLETVARVLCVQSHGVMVCGASASSVAHFSNPHLCTPHSVCNSQTLS